MATKSAPRSCAAWFARPCASTRPSATRRADGHADPRSGLPRGGLRRRRHGVHGFVSPASGEKFEVKVKKREVDATYLQPAIPANTRPPFEIAPGVRCVAVNDLPRMAPQAASYTIIGAGKTAIDACLWLLEI